MLFVGVLLFALVIPSQCASIRTAATSYDASLAMTSWYYSKAAFCTVADIESWACSSCAVNSGMVDVKVFHEEVTGAQAFAGYNTDKNTVVVSFRGSADIQNWINNLDFFLIDYNSSACSTFNGGVGTCQVHRGFYNVYGSISTALLRHAETLASKYQSKRPAALVTGHSLGGALTILGAVDVTLRLRSLVSGVGVYTFGEPRVGNPAWAKWVSEAVLIGGKQYRVTHESDPVPRLPPLEFGFLHVPHEVWYNNDDAGNNFTFCADNATAEDYTNCENTQYAFTPADHLLYLGVHAGCNA